jgi:hypothetical protein
MKAPFGFAVSLRKDIFNGTLLKNRVGKSKKTTGAREGFLIPRKKTRPNRI